MDVSSSSWKKPVAVSNRTLFEGHLRAVYADVPVVVIETTVQGFDWLRTYASPILPPDRAESSLCDWLIVPCESPEAAYDLWQRLPQIHDNSGPFTRYCEPMAAVWFNGRWIHGRLWLRAEHERTD